MAYYNEIKDDFISEANEKIDKSRGFSRVIRDTAVKAAMKKAMEAAHNKAEAVVQKKYKKLVKKTIVQLLH
jgi:DNA replication initiation complex subunit (GINS family)